MISSLHLAERSWSSRWARGADEFAQGGDIWPVCPDACRIDRQTKALGAFHVDARIIEFREAKPDRWKNALSPTRINRSRRTATLPGTACDCEELVPIVFVPHRSLPRLRDLGRYGHEMRQLPLWSLPGVRLVVLVLKCLRPTVAICWVYGTSRAASSIDSGMFQARYEREIIALDRNGRRKYRATLFEWPRQPQPRNVSRGTMRQPIVFYPVAGYRGA